MKNKITIIISMWVLGINAQPYKNIADNHSCGLYLLDGINKINWNGYKSTQNEKYDATIGVTYLNKYYYSMSNSSLSSKGDFIYQVDGGGKLPFHIHNSDWNVCSWVSYDLGIIPIKFYNNNVSLKIGTNLCYIKLREDFYSSYSSPNINWWYVISNKAPNIMGELGIGGTIWLELFHDSNKFYVDLIASSNISPHTTSLKGGIHLGCVIDPSPPKQQPIKPIKIYNKNNNKIIKQNYSKSDKNELLIASMTFVILSTLVMVSN